jgi:hypothetical protein
MNDEDLERQLRSQRGPREEGYSPKRLPMTMEDATVGNAGPSRRWRAGMFVGVAAAGALAVAVVAAILSGPGSGVGNTGSGSPAASESGSCAIGDVALSAEPWGGAAGSRGTVVTVSLAAGRNPCYVPKAVQIAQIADAQGKLLVNGQSAPATGSVLVEPSASFEIGVAWSNWCGGDVAQPVTLSLAFDGWASPQPVAMRGPLGSGTPPPCNGTGPSALSVTELQAKG